MIAKTLQPLKWIPGDDSALDKIVTSSQVKLGASAEWNVETF